MKKLAVLFSIALVGAAAVAAEYPDISVTELKSALESKKVTIIDVNGASYLRS